MVIVGSGLYNPTGRIVGDTDWLCSRREWKTYLHSRMDAGAKITKLEWFDDKGLAVIDSHHEEASFIDHNSAIRKSDLQIYQLVRNNLYSPWMIVYLMKYSHRFKKDSPHFEKTRNDIRVIEEQHEGVRQTMLADPVLSSILKSREAATYTNQLPKLNQGKKEFFTDSVPYVYDHDTIHEAVKHLDKPAYMYYMADNAQVMCDKQRWEALSHQTKLLGVLEESYVLAIERAIVPFGTDPYRAFKKALEKVCTSITSGWFREFAWEHYYDVLAMYHPSFIGKFQSALEAGQIKPFKEGVC